MSTKKLEVTKLASRGTLAGTAKHCVGLCLRPLGWLLFEETPSSALADLCELCAGRSASTTQGSGRCPATVDVMRPTLADGAGNWFVKTCDIGRKHRSRDSSAPEFA